MEDPRGEVDEWSNIITSIPEGRQPVPKLWDINGVVVDMGPYRHPPPPVKTASGHVLVCNWRFLARKAFVLVIVFCVPILE